MEQTLIILQLSSTDLKNIIRAAATEALQAMEIRQADRLMNVKEAARFLDLAPQTLYGFTSQRKIPFIKRGKKLYFKQTELEAWLNSGKVNEGASNGLGDLTIFEWRDKADKAGLISQRLYNCLSIFAHGNLKEQGKMKISQLTWEHVRQQRGFGQGTWNEFQTVKTNYNGAL